MLNSIRPAVHAQTRPGRAVAERFRDGFYYVTPKLLYAELTLVYKGGVFYSALPATCKHSHVDVRDIAAVAVAALTESGHEGKVYRITGPEALTYQQVAEILSDASGKRVRYDNSLENYSRFLKDSGLDVNEVLELDAWVAKGAGEGSAVTNTIFELTGQQPIRFAQFAEDYSQRF